MSNVRVDEENLILLVQEHRYLWDLRDPEYKNNTLKKNAWDSIAQQLHTTDMVAKNKWRNLRDTFARKLAEINQPSGSGYKHVRWKFYEQMSFLKDMLASRHRVGNLESSWQDESIEYLEESDDLLEHLDPANKQRATENNRKRKQDDRVLQDIVNVEKERNELLKQRQQKSSNYHVMMSVVTLLDSLPDLNDQLDASEEILEFAYQVIKSKRRKRTNEENQKKFSLSENTTVYMLIPIVSLNRQHSTMLSVLVCVVYSKRRLL
ncbi:uncharacterized protein LOC133391417 isoform X1 [Anopheles gambiae]|uniref:uncharacterized protein LOC133391417 isoform X1 n=1 Tax=Anopheles gambiae TaxID=7165 RepID=UPI002AC9A004|nr:uncharacterized protein LOC133391417 isoform X1 [Anopheles gambiae]